MARQRFVLSPTTCSIDSSTIVATQFANMIPRAPLSYATTTTAYYPPGQQSSSIWNNPQRYDMPSDEQAGSAGTGSNLVGYASPNFHYQVPPTNTPYSTTPVYQTDSNMLLNDGEQ